MEPVRCFDPFRVPGLGRKWSVQIGGDRWLARYVDAATHASTANGVCTIHVNWTDMTWLMGLGRQGEDDRRSDADIFASLLPDPHYMFVDRDDPPRQALEWYLTRHSEIGGPRSAGAPPPDFQEVRWLETLVRGQAQAWNAYFRIHELSPHLVRPADVRSRPDVTVRTALENLGLEYRPSQHNQAGFEPEQQVEPRIEAWFGAYSGVRRGLNGAVGVRTSRARTGQVRTRRS